MLLWTATTLWLDRPRPAPPGPFDLIVVLGCRVLPDGALSPTLARRVACGAEAYHQGLGPKVLVTGGAVQGAPQEAAAMADTLQREHGVPSEDILLETQAQNTWDNAHYTLQMAPDARMLVVSCNWHLPRALLHFRNLGADAEGLGARGPLPDRLQAAAREAPAYWLARWRGSGPL